MFLTSWENSMCGIRLLRFNPDNLDANIVVLFIGLKSDWVTRQNGSLSFDAVRTEILKFPGSIIRLRNYSVYSPRYM